MAFGLKDSRIIDYEDEDISLVKTSESTHLANIQLKYEGGLKDYQNRGILNERFEEPYQLVRIEI